jgi:phage-related protein
LEVVIAGDSRGAKKAFADTEKAAGGFKSKMAGVSKSMLKFGGAMTAGVTLPIAAALTVAVKAAAEEEKSQALLRRSLKNTVHATDETVNKTEEWITATQNATGVLDDELRPALARLLRAGIPLNKAQHDLGIALDIAAASGKPLKTVIEAMGKAAQGNVGALARIGIATKDAAGNTLSYDEALKKAAETMGGSAKDAADTTSGRAAIMNAKFEDLKETIGEALLPVLEDLADTLGKIVDKFDKLTPQQQKWIVYGALALAVVGPLSIAFGGLAAAVGLAATPIGAMVLAAAALSAGLVTLYNNNQTFKDGVDSVSNFLIQEAGPRFVEFGSMIGDSVAGAVEVVQRNWPQIERTITTVLGHIRSVTSTVLEGIRMYWNTFGQRIYDNVNRVFRGIQGIIGVAMNIIRGIVQVATNIIRGDWSGALDAILRTTRRVWSGVIGVFQNAIGIIRNLGSGMAQVGRGIVEGIWRGISGAAGWLRDKIAGFAQGIKDKITSFFKIRSPSKWAEEEVGRRIAQGIGVGMSNNMPGIPSMNMGAISAGGGASMGSSRSYADNRNIVFNISGDNAQDIGRQVEQILRREAAFAGATADSS